jgi:hypothetical protein
LSISYRSNQLKNSNFYCAIAGEDLGCCRQSPGNFLVAQHYSETVDPGASKVWEASQKSAVSSRLQSTPALSEQKQNAA